MLTPRYPKPIVWTGPALLTLFVIAVLALTCGSVQGQCYQIGGPYIQQPDSLGPVILEGFNYSDTRITDSDYWFFCENQLRFYPSRWETSGKLYRRLDRWYLDTVQVCDTVNVTVSLQILLEGFDIGERYIPSIAYQVICRDTTIYAKRVKKTETKWVIPGESK